jgi:hypothetical protein
VPNTSFTDFEVLRTGTTEKLTVFVRDPKNDELTDVYASSTFQLINIEDDSVVYSTTFTADGGTGIDHPAVGTYQFDFDTSTYNEDYIASFRCLLEGDVVTYNIFVKSESAKVFAQAASLRVQVDKARKSVSDDIANMDRADNEPAVQFFYGYTDAHLIYYLERGAQLINAIPPYTAFTPAAFPWAQYGTILTDGAVIAALESQGIFAIDTDYNYSLGGNSLVIDHFTKLNSYLSGLLTRFDKNTIRFKQQYRSKGVIMFQFLPGGVRAARQLSAMPNGFWSRLLSTSFT